MIVADNGRGFPDGVKPSYGIAGMSERVWATGGEMRLTNRPGGGARSTRGFRYPAGNAKPRVHAAVELVV